MGRVTSTDAQAVRTYQVRTYGCQMNVHDSERLAGLLEAAGYQRADDGADGTRTCTRQFLIGALLQLSTVTNVPLG